MSQAFIFWSVKKKKLGKNNFNVHETEQGSRVLVLASWE